MKLDYQDNMTVYVVTLSWFYPEDGARLVGVFSTREAVEQALKDVEEEEAKTDRWATDRWAPKYADIVEVELNKETNTPLK